MELRNCEWTAPPGVVNPLTLQYVDVESTTPGLAMCELLSQAVNVKELTTDLLQFGNFKRFQKLQHLGMVGPQPRWPIAELLTVSTQLRSIRLRMTRLCELTERPFVEELARHAPTLHIIEILTTKCTPEFYLLFSRLILARAPLLRTFRFSVRDSTEVGDFAWAALSRINHSLTIRAPAVTVALGDFAVRAPPGSVFELGGAPTPPHFLFAKYKQLVEEVMRHERFRFGAEGNIRWRIVACLCVTR